MSIAHIEEWMLLVSYQDVIIESSCSLPLLYKLVSHWVVHCGLSRAATSAVLRGDLKWDWASNSQLQGLRVAPVHVPMN